MKELINKSSAFYRIEFWVATAIFVLVLFFHITDALGTDWNNVNKDAVLNHTTVSLFIARLVRYVAFYLAFIILSFTVIPRLLAKEKIVQHLLLLLIVYVLLGAVIGATDTYLKSHLIPTFSSDRAYFHFIYSNSFLYSAWLLLVFGFYSVIKYAGLYLLLHSDVLHSRYRFITYGGLTVFVLWLLVMFLLLVNNAERVLMAMWAVIIPFGILFHWLALYTLIPAALRARKPLRNFLWKIFLLVAFTYPVITLLAMLFLDNDEPGLAVGSLNAVFQLLVTAPLSWFIYKRQIKGNEELYTLRTKLGQSTASFDFLRSQINPHFLFNALNTLYGTALQEGAERTGEGVQKLGDMMRFMLQENMQDKISLSREIDYLTNYISLQKLRTDPVSSISIRTDIRQQLPTIQIAPMLLIPFVENAFKHGISFREPSHITITLDVIDNILSFDVYNSKHIRQDSDPEKDKSGIGLPNVRQRLQLIYPSKHDLVVRETAKDFFVHLTIQLS